MKLKRFQIQMNVRSVYWWLSILMPVLFTQDLSLTRQCPTMTCITKDNPVWNDTLLDNSNYTCYNWDSSKVYPFAQFTIKECLHGDQICDIYSQSDQADYTINDKDQAGGNFQEDIVNEIQGLRKALDLTGQKTSQWCTFQESIWQNLHVGTKCLFSWQCQSDQCVGGTCVGDLLGTACYGRDHQCDLGLQCKQVLPTESTRVNKGQCSLLLTPGAECEVLDTDGITREYKCPPGYKCGKVLSDSSEPRTCLQMYSLPEGTESDDGELCFGGHHFRSSCTSVVSVSQAKASEEVLAEPYQCDLATSFYCNAKYSNGNSAIFGQCQCSWESAGAAYCPFSGQADYNSQFTLYKAAAEESQLCHPDVVTYKLFAEWETCTSNPDLVFQYKTAYYTTLYWAPLQYAYKEAFRNPGILTCLNTISAIRFDSRVIYNTIEKLSDKL